MVVNRNINNKSDIQKILNIYIPIIRDYTKNMVLSYNEIQRQLKIEFNIVVTLEDVLLYFETTINEEKEDLKQQVKNLGVGY